MLYQEKEISGKLSDFIHCCWLFDSQEEEVVHTILPDGYFDLILTFQDESLITKSLTGTWTKAKDIRMKKRTRMFGIRFRLLAAEYLFCNSIQPLLDTSVELRSDYSEIEPSCSCSLNDFQEQVIRFFSVRISAVDQGDQRKIKLFQILYGLNGAISVAELAAEIGWSSRQINRWLNHQFGLSLKIFSNILKCHAAYRPIANGKLFPDAAYYDQAHFIKEIRRFTGVSPKELHQNKNDRFLQLSGLSKS